MFDGKAQSEMLYRAVDLGLATYQKPFLSALKYCHLSEQFDKFRLDHVGGHHTLCPAKMKGHGEDRDLRSVGCHLKEETGSATSTQGWSHSTGSQLTGGIFQIGLEQPGQSSSSMALTATTS